MLAVGCSGGQAPRAFGKPDQDAINQLVQEFIKIYNGKDAQKLSMLFTGGGSVMPPNASAVRGTENVREYYVNRFAQGASDLVLEPQTVTGVGVPGYESWWDVAVAEVSEQDGVRQARKAWEAGKARERWFF